jgi:hypothetical protein
VPVDYRLGKKPARFGAILMSVQDYFALDKLPTPPPSFGNYAPQYRMGLNDKLGTCVIVGAQNETIDWYNDVGRQVEFDDAGIRADYTAVAGFDPHNARETDNGTDMGAMARYRKNTGILDAHGQRHKVDGYAKVPLHRLDWIKTLAWLFGGVGFGFLFPTSAKGQFDRGEPWAVVQGDDIEGGHYVPLLGLNEAGNFVCTSWGQRQEMTQDFAMKYMDELIVWFDLDRMKDGLSPENFNEAALVADLAAVA